MDNETDSKRGIIGENGTEKYQETSFIGMLREPQWVVVVYFVVLGCGAVVNVVHALALVRSRKNGILSLILQLAIVDISLIYVAVSEILTLNHKSWYFPSEYCPIFKGTEVLINTLTIYLLICFNFHVISLWNLHHLEITKNTRNPLTSCSNDDSNECLVTKQENRLVTIDYRKRKDDISIIFPTIFIWIVSLSLSVPNFTLSSTLKLKENYALCAVIDMFYGQVLQNSLLIFKVVLPSVLLLVSLVILGVKLNKTSKSDIDNIVTKRMNEIRRLLIFGMVLTILYCLTSFQRHFLHFIHIMSYSFTKNSMNNFKMPPLYNSFLSTPNMMYFAMLHYSGSTFRGLLYLALLPKFPHLVRTKMFPCCKIKQ